MDLHDLLPFLNDQPEIVQRIAVDVFPFAVALLLIIVLRWLLTWIVLRPLRIVVSRTESKVDDDLLEASVSPVRIAVVGISLLVVSVLFAFDVEVVQIAQVIGRSLVIFAVFYGLVNFLNVVSLQPTAVKQVTGLNVPERLLPFLNTVIKYLIIALGAIFVLQEFGLDVAALIASLGVIGIGISLASQDTVSNMFGFAAIVSDNPFKVGDYIRTPAVSGIVETVGLRSTRVRQLDQALVTVPNNLLTNAVVLNWSRVQKRRLDVTLNFTYSTSAEQMRAVVAEIRELLQNTEDVDPESVIVHFIDFGSSSLDVRIIGQVLLADWREFTAKKEELFLGFIGIAEELGIEFAFPSQSVYIESIPERGVIDGSRAQYTDELAELRAADEESGSSGQ